MGLTSFFKVIIDPTKSSSSWVRSSCKKPRTLSFRVGDEDVYNTVNSIYSFDPTDQLPWLEKKDATCNLVSESFSSASKEEESVTQGLISDRLFFERGGETSPILVESKLLMETTTTTTTAATLFAGDEEDLVPFKESVAEEMESENPYMDFRISMEEMVISHGLKDWEFLEQLLEWYLRMNVKKTHGFILGAFVDLLLDLATLFSSSSLDSFYSSSSSPSSCLCTCSSSSLTTNTTTTTFSSSSS